MDTNEMLHKLETYKAKLDAGEELTPGEKAELEAIGKYIAEAIQAFITAVQEALAPALEAIAKVVKEIWDSLPEPTRDFLRKESEPPLRTVLGDVATPYSEAQQRVFVPPYDSEARTAQHYSGRGGW